MTEHAIALPWARESAGTCSSSPRLPCPSPPPVCTSQKGSHATPTPTRHRPAPTSESTTSSPSTELQHQSAIPAESLGDPLIRPSTDRPRRCPSGTGGASMPANIQPTRPDTYPESEMQTAGSLRADLTTIEPSRPVSDAPWAMERHGHPHDDHTIKPTSVSGARSGK